GNRRGPGNPVWAGAPRRCGARRAGAGYGRSRGRGTHAVTAEHHAQTAGHHALDPDARGALEAVRAEVGKAIIGQDPVLTGLVICLLCRGHVLLEGVAGVAKTLLVRALAAALSLRSTRVQFTPDLMPGDVTGSLVYDAK